MKNLSIAVLISPILNYIRNEQGKYIFSGYEGRFLQVILEAFGVESEFINILVVRNAIEASTAVHLGEANMAFTYLVQHYTLLDKVDFSMPYSISAYTFGVRKSIPLETKFSFLYPFTLQVWIGCLTVAVVLPLCYMFLVKTNFSYIELFSYIWVGIFKPPLRLLSDSFRNRILLVSSLIFKVIISFSYAAVLLSFLANPLMNPPIRHFEELSEATKTSGTKVYCVDSAYAKGVLKDADQVYLKSLGQYIEEHNYYYWFDSVNYAELYAEGSAFIMVVPSLLEVESIERYSAFISNDNIAYMLLSVYMNKRFCCKKRLNSIISRLWQAGIYRKIQNDEAMKVMITTQKFIHEINLVRPLSIDNLFGVFMLLIIGYIIASLALAYEIFLNRKELWVLFHQPGASCQE